MKKNILTVIYIILVVLIIFLIQLFLVNPRSLFGIKPNLILIMSIVISLWYGIYIGGISSFCLGVMTDLLFGSTSGIFTIAYTIVGILIGALNYNYRKENKMSLVYVTIIATSLFEIIQFLCYIFFYDVSASILYLLKQVIISSLLNIIIVYIVYSGIYNISEYIEDRITQSRNGL
jgi:rod shape-determining protein MreD